MIVIIVLAILTTILLLWRWHLDLRYMYERIDGKTPVKRTWVRYVPKRLGFLFAWMTGIQIMLPFVFSFEEKPKNTTLLVAEGASLTTVTLVYLVYVYWAAMMEQFAQSRVKSGIMPESKGGPLRRWFADRRKVASLWSSVWGHKGTLGFLAMGILSIGGILVSRSLWAFGYREAGALVCSFCLTGFILLAFTVSASTKGDALLYRILYN